MTVLEIQITPIVLLANVVTRPHLEYVIRTLTTGFGIVLQLVVVLIQILGLPGHQIPVALVQCKQGIAPMLLVVEPLQKLNGVQTVGDQIRLQQEFRYPVNKCIFAIPGPAAAHKILVF